jgi:hypothetical protein
MIKTTSFVSFSDTFVTFLRKMGAKQTFFSWNVSATSLVLLIIKYHRKSEDIETCCQEWFHYLSYPIA